MVFLENVNNLVEVMLQMGNPFEEESSDLLTLDTKDIAHPDRANLIMTHYNKGKEQFHAFLKEMKGESFYDPIKRNEISFF